MESNKLSLTDVIAPVYRRLHLNRKNHVSTHNFIEGGRNSAKSSDVSIEVILDMIEDDSKKHLLLLFLISFYGQ